MAPFVVLLQSTHLTKRPLFLPNPMAPFFAQSEFLVNATTFLRLLALSTLGISFRMPPTISPLPSDRADFSGKLLSAAHRQKHVDQDALLLQVNEDSLENA